MKLIGLITFTFKLTRLDALIYIFIIQHFAEFIYILKKFYLT